MATGVVGFGLTVAEGYLTGNSGKYYSAGFQFASGIVVGQVVTKYGGAMARALTSNSQFSLGYQKMQISTAFGGYIDAGFKYSEE